MNNKELIQKIKDLGPWYQNVKFNDEVSAVSSHSRLSGEHAWEYLKIFLPEDMTGLKVLDLGSNAGLFSIRCAQRGAEVIGFENNNGHLRQANFLKEYFGTDKVEFFKIDLEKSPLMKCFTEFDIVLAVSVLYWVGRFDKPHYCESNRNREIEYIEHLTNITDEVIVRCRGTQYNNSLYYGEIFMGLGFHIERIIQESGSKNSHEWIHLRRDK